jgi:predicted acetyltransferase
MSEIRELTQAELPAFIAVAANAYPDFPMRTEEERRRVIERFTAQIAVGDTSVHGLVRDGALLGGMKLYDFTMNIHGTQLLTGGVGFVAVDLLHKKEHVAKELIEYFLRYYRDRGAVLTELYPFRPDFYRQMGFGYGTQMSEYPVTPASLPKGPSKAHIAYLTTEDKDALAACYNRLQVRTHGMIAVSPGDYTRWLENPEVRVVGYKRDGHISGYLVFTFKQTREDTFMVNNISVTELIYETREALSELLTFLNTQSDQIRRIILRTQDASFYHLLSDPRDGSDIMIPSVYHQSNAQGVGLMYRVLDIAGFFRALGAHDFGGQTLRLKLAVADSFLSENDDGVTVQFERGRARVAEDGGASDAELRLGVAEFSSLVMGAVSFRRLYDYGLADISDSTHVETVHRLFLTAEPPICTTLF